MASRPHLRRIYDDPSPDDGLRVLVDRVWPRGVSKEAAHLDEWMKEVAPSTPLRRWYGHRPERFAEFRRRYRTELADANHASEVRRLRDLTRQGPVTLLTATKDIDHSQAAVLTELLGDTDDPHDALTTSGRAFSGPARPQNRAHLRPLD